MAGPEQVFSRHTEVALEFDCCETQHCFTDEIEGYIYLVLQK